MEPPGDPAAFAEAAAPPPEPPGCPDGRPLCTADPVGLGEDTGDGLGDGLPDPSGEAVGAGDGEPAGGPESTGDGGGEADGPCGPGDWAAVWPGEATDGPGPRLVPGATDASWLGSSADAGGLVGRTGSNP